MLVCASVIGGTRAASSRADRSRWSTPDPPSLPRRRPAGHLVRPLVGADRGRRLPRARRPGVERPLLAVADGRPAAAAPGARCRWRRCPPIDAVIISHDHYDHLDIDTDQAAGPHPARPFFVPLGIGAHLRKWGIPDDRIVELDWNESAQIGELDAGVHPGPALLRTVPDPQHHAVGVVGDRSGRGTAPSSAATPATPRASPKSARTTGLST